MKRYPLPVQRPVLESPSTRPHAVRSMTSLHELPELVEGDEVVFHEEVVLYPVSLSFPGMPGGKHD